MDINLKKKPGCVLILLMAPFIKFPHRGCVFLAAKLSCTIKHYRKCQLAVIQRHKSGSFHEGYRHKDASPTRN